ncbi:colorectal cancer associated 2 [Hypomesus transpacificus]|uniref:colorectal cancer associated 2 n=1 Tax=Hypomesus transpacificus TaxID=137520 RepID=UPI001F07C00A|nr:colorectal cancer associated 2 [Hypomesus transpacificus]
MSEKPKVYQGVRVKTTVKELLQQRRAELAAVKTLTPEFVQQDEFVSTLPAHYYDSFTGDSSGGAQQSLQSNAFQDPTGTVPLDNVFQNQQLLNVLRPEDSFGSSPLPTPLQAWPYGHQSSVDYYSHVMDSSSPSESLNQPSPVDYNGYSPQPSSSSSSSSSSSCYNSPSRMESGYGFAPDHYYCQNCSRQPCYCLPQWSVGPSECLPALDYGAYGHTDCEYPSALQDSFCRRDLINSEMCYL